MPNIKTPNTLWSNFDLSLDTEVEKVFESTYSGVKIERVAFSGRDTGNGRVRIAAAFASSFKTPSPETVIIFPDSNDTIDFDTLKFFVKQGYSALMVDYRGEWEGCEFYTKYPENVSYANLAKCGRAKDFVDDSADKTSWYEWVAVGLYARKYVAERTQSDKIAVVGIRDGGEIAWKLGFAGQFSCIVPAGAAGWKAYNGISKYMPEEPNLDEERYRFIAGIDSQAYAPAVRCPVLMLCPAIDNRFDYDRAYDTFSRINPEFIKGSAIAYTINCNGGIDADGVKDMFLFFDKYLKNRQVFIPRPADVLVEVDENSNLVAKIVPDTQGVAEKSELYLAEDCTEPSLRAWERCPVKSENEFYINLFEKTATIFVLCRVQYANGFSVWSKIYVKKISGKFRNMRVKCRVLYSDKNDSDGFFAENTQDYAIGGMFFADDAVMPRLVSKGKGGAKGLHSECGLSTFKNNCQRYAPTSASVLSLDLYTDKSDTVTVTFADSASQTESFSCAVPVVGGVWQSFVLEAKNFKSANGTSLADFTGELKMTVSCRGEFVLNNVMWL